MERTKRRALSARSALTAVGGLILATGMMSSPASADDYIPTPGWEGRRPAVFNDCNGGGDPSFNPQCKYNVVNQQLVEEPWRQIGDVVNACTDAQENTYTKTASVNSSTTVSTSDTHSVGIDVGVKIKEIIDVGVNYTFSHEEGTSTTYGTTSTTSNAHKQVVPKGWIGWFEYQATTVHSDGYVSVQYDRPVYDKKSWDYPSSGSTGVHVVTPLKGGDREQVIRFRSNMIPCDTSPTTITSQKSGTCLDKDLRSNWRVQIYACHGGVNQLWTFKKDGQVRNFATNQCLRHLFGRLVELVDCGNTAYPRAELQWQRTGEDDKLRDDAGNCLDVEGGLVADGSGLILYPCKDYNDYNQRWTVTTVTQG